MQNTVSFKNLIPSKTRTVLSWVVPIVLAPAIVFAVFFFMLYAFEVFPFGGDHNTLSQYDLLAQIVPFAEHFFDVMKGEASLFYSYRVAGGMDVFGTVAYCLCSPFTFLFFVFGEGKAMLAASVILPAKLSCIAVSAIVFLKLRFKGINPLFVLPVALLYAFAGYTFVANTYINWMDFSIYLPLALLGFEYMVKTGKIRYFAVCIALCIYSCFSIACFSMLLSYPVLVIYGLMVVEKKERKSYLFRLSLAYLSGVIAALPIMLPALGAYLVSGRNTGIFDSLFKATNWKSYYSKCSYILSDALFVVLIAYYFVKTHFSTKESRFLGVAGLIVLMPVLVDECCLLMNMGSYYSYSYRFGFLNAVYELYIAGLVLSELNFARKITDRSVLELKVKKPLFKSKGERAPKPVKQAPLYVQIPLTVLLTVLAAFSVLVIYEMFTVNRNIDGLDFTAFPALESVISSAKQASSGFPGSFAHSLGGLEGMLILFAVIALISVVAIVFTEFKLVNLKLSYPVVSVVLVAQIIYFSAILVCGNIFTPTYYRAYNEVMERVLDEEEDTVRIKDNDAAFTNVFGLTTDTNSPGVFSSVTDRRNFAFNEVFGYNGNKTNTMRTSGGSFFGDSLMGMKYVLGKKSSTALDYDYLTKVDENEKFVVYENELVFPDCYTVPGKELSITTDFNAYFENMQNLYAFLGGEGEIFDTYSPSAVYERTVKNTETEEELPAFYLTFPIVESGTMAFYTEIDDPNVLYAKTAETKEFYSLSKVKTYSYHNAAPSRNYFIYILGGDSGITKEEVFQKCKYKVISKPKIEALQAKLNANKSEYKIVNSFFTTKFVVEANAQTDGSLFLNYVHIKGMAAYVNGVKTPLTENGLNMTVVPVQAGENHIEIVYTSPYYAYMLAGVVIVTAYFVGIYFALKGKKLVAVAETVVSVAALLLAGVVVLIFMAFPTGVFFIKLIGLI